jgi:WD40 repeat protein
LDLSPDGRFAALAQDNANPFDPRASLAVLDLRTGRKRSLQALPISAWITHVEFTPDGASIVGRSFDGGVRVWDVASGSIVQTFSGQGSGLNAALTPDGRTVLSGGQDGSVAAWDLSGARRLGRTFRWHSPEAGCGTTPCIVIDPRSQHLAESMAHGKIALVDLHARRLVGTLPARNGASADALAFSPDSKTLATGGVNRNVTLWTVGTRSIVRTLPFRERVWWIAFSPDGKLLAVQTKSGRSSDSHVEVRDFDSGIVLYRRVVAAGKGGLAFTPDGRKLAALGCCEPDSTVEVWAARSGAKLFSPHVDGHARSIAFSPDGRLLAAGTEDGKVVLWDAGNGSEVGAPTQVATGSIDPISFSPNSRLFSASSGDQTATVWNVRTRKRLGNTFPIEQGSIPVARFTPAGDLVIENLVDTAIWPMDLSSWERFACQVAGRDLTRGEWTALLPSRPYQHVCPG